MHKLRKYIIILLALLMPVLMVANPASAAYGDWAYHGADKGRVTDYNNVFINDRECDGVKANIAVVYGSGSGVPRIYYDDNCRRSGNYFDHRDGIAAKWRVCEAGSCGNWRYRFG